MRLTASITQPQILITNRAKTSNGKKQRRQERRASIMSSNNGFIRRKHRTNILRHSPDENSGLELQESLKLRDGVKRNRDRERARDSLRERPSRNSKIIDETSNESENDDGFLDDEFDETTLFISNNHHRNHNSSIGVHQHNIISGNYHLQHRKNFPPISSSTKVYKALAPVWKAGDEMIGVSVPRKARSASTKRLYDLASNSSYNSNNGVVSPSSSNTSTRKKLKHNSGNGNGKPPKVISKTNSSNPAELEIEIAEVLYGLMNQSSKNEDFKSNPNSNSANIPISRPDSTPISSIGSWS